VLLTETIACIGSCLHSKRTIYLLIIAFLFPEFHFFNLFIKLLLHLFFTELLIKNRYYCLFINFLKFYFLIIFIQLNFPFIIIIIIFTNILIFFFFIFIITTLISTIRTNYSCFTLLFNIFDLKFFGILFICLVQF